MTRAARRMSSRQQVQAGLVPWDEEGFLDAFRAWQELIANAVRRARTSRGGRVTFRLPTRQMGRHFVRRYGPARGTAHFIRWLKVGDFLAAHLERLQADSLVRADIDGSMDFSRDLIASLCAVRFRAAPSRAGRGRQAGSAIALSDVLRRVRGLQARAPTATSASRKTPAAR